MPNKPTSYDDITRRTVPELDGSVRPTKEQEEAAYDGSRLRGVEEATLRQEVEAALREHIDGDRVIVEVHGTDVELRGTVRSIEAVNELEAVVRVLPGVGGLANKLVVGS